MKRTSLFICLLLAVMLVISGCSANSVNLRSKELTSHVNNRKILIIVTAEDDDIKVINHIPGMGRQSMMTMFVLGGGAGYLGAKIGSGMGVAILSRKSLGGGIGILRKELDEKQAGAARIKEVLEDDLEERFLKKHELSFLRKADYKVKKERFGRKLKINDFASNAKDVDADIILQIDFIYGLAAYRGERASAAMDARVSVYDINSGEVVMRRDVSSDVYFKSGHTVDEFAADGARIFSEDIMKAADGLSLRIASEFDIDLDEAARRRIDFDEKIAYNEVTCQRPYAFTQGCSGDRRQIKFNNYIIWISGTEAGDVVELRKFRRKRVADDPIKDTGGMDAAGDNLEDELLEQVRPKIFYEDAFEDLQAYIESKGVKVVKIIEVVTSGKMSTSGGFILELDGDGYSILKNYSKDKDCAGLSGQEDAEAI